MRGLREELLPMRRVPNALHVRRPLGMLPMRCVRDELPMRRAPDALHARCLSGVLPMRCVRDELPIRRAPNALFVRHPLSMLPMRFSENGTLSFRGSSSNAGQKATAI